MNAALTTLGEIIHQLQKERGRMAIFLYSEGKLFADKLPMQFSQSDLVIGGLKRALKSEWDRPEIETKLRNKLKTCADTLTELDSYRSQIQNFEVSVAQSIDFYSHRLIGPILQVMVQIALNAKDANPVFVSAYNAFLNWKERIGVERAVAARGFVQDSFKNPEFVERILFLLSEQHTHRNTFLALANLEQKELLSEVLNGPAYKNLHAVHNALRKSPNSEVLHTMTPEDWFDLITDQIDALHQVEIRLVQTLSADEIVEERPKPAEDDKITLSGLGEFEDLVASLKFFQGLNSKDFQSLIKQGQVRRFSKGKLLFLEGEQANRLYIILKGWIKIFKGTAAGDEAILQMLSSGDPVLESAVLLNSTFTVSAQVVEDAVVISFPAPLIRQQVRDNSDLAVNLLSDMSYRSQRLIGQIENTRLKSVDQRIGWFLLQLLHNQEHMSRHIELPYDKSLIASYLDMKRETFSRALKRLKANGIRVENDTIILPDMLALCQFCDAEIQGSCTLSDTKRCPNANRITA